METLPDLRVSQKRLVLTPYPLAAINPGKNFEHECVYNPSAVEKDGTVYLFYRAEDTYGEYVSSIALALSRDGVHFERYAGNPVLKPEGPEEARGCEDPRITFINGKYHMFYTAFESVHDDVYKVHEALATSEDLFRWEKRGIVLPGMKSFALFPEKIQGRYCGVVGDKNIHLAHSDDLLHWHLDPIPLLEPREGQFDSFLVEPGPPPFLYGDMWCFIYNSSNRFSYDTGYCFLDRENPQCVLHRSARPILSPRASWQKFGKVNNVVFATGLVQLQSKWLLYYGGADKVVGIGELQFQKTKTLTGGPPRCTEGH